MSFAVLARNRSSIEVVNNACSLVVLLYMANGDESAWNQRPKLSKIYGTQTYQSKQYSATNIEEWGTK